MACRGPCPYCKGRLAVRLISALRAAIVLAVVAAALGGAANASAYCNNWEAGGYETCAGSYGDLYQNAVVAMESDTWATCAGAQTSSGSFYGHYFCASSWSCHDYGGGGLTPLAHNHEGFGQRITGYPNESWIGGCPRGGIVSLTSSAGALSRSDVATQPASTYNAGSLRCIRVPDGRVGDGVTCADAATVEKRGLVGALVGGADKTGDELPGDQALVALAPAGASSATLKRDDGTATRLSVKGGLVQASLDGDETALVWDTPAAAVRLP